MAGRSSGNGVWVLITILSVLCLGLVTSTFYFVSKSQANARDLASLQAETEVFVKSSERGNDQIRRIVERAGQERKSAIGYMNDMGQELASLLTGNPRENIETIRKRVGSNGVNSSDLIGQINDLNNTIAAKDQEIASIDSARERAMSDREAEINRIESLRQSHESQIASIMEQITTYQAEIDQLRSGVNSLRDSADDQMVAMKGRYEEQIRQLRDDNRELVIANQAFQKKIREHQESSRGQISVGNPEEALVDGKVIGVDAAANTVTISRGRQDRVRLGMTFAVYSRASAIAPNAAGEYAAPKARLEIIRINETSSDARVVGIQPGQAVVREDVIANAVYDPNKTYKFVTFGSFDANGDRIATPLEADQIRAQISQWGGLNVDELTGDVDFVVLGERPIVPPPPPVDAKPEVVKEWERIYAMASRYDQLFEDARSTFIPVLNQNRFYTLIGKRYGDLR
ncbi:MAG: hypothetical protein H6815_06190 [Phycisphaeraceae bacterium]|nr:hypothetical protein [Phycisphaerales bacterium]MCB9860028.1 hypothetical protein [Phycisphaeraceae bacterium]